jgi:hypothetical protein
MAGHDYRSKRRAFLKLLGGAGAVSAAASVFPWLKARGDGATCPPKLLFFYTPHGTIWDRWRPTGGETDFSLSYILNPLAAHRNDLVIIDGLGIQDPYSHRVPHTYDMPALFTGSPIDTTSTMYERVDHGVTFGWNTGVSVDQTIANRLMPPTPHRSIELGTACGGSHPNARMIYTGPAAPRQTHHNPPRAWDQLFSSFVEPEPARTPIRRGARMILRTSQIRPNSAAVNSASTGTDISTR